MSNEEKSSVGDIFSWYNKCTAWLNQEIDWLFPTTFTYPDNSIGVLMRRNMDKKSWIDSIASIWVAYPLWLKLLIIVASTLGAGLIGFLVGSPIILPLSVLFSCVCTHVLCVSHEHTRFERAQLMAQDSLEVLEGLEESKKLLNESTKAVQAMTEQIHSQTILITKNNEQVHQELNMLKNQHDQLAKLVEEITNSTENMMSSEQRMAQTLSEVNEQLIGLYESIQGTREQVTQLEYGANQFNQTVSDVGSIQKQYADMVTQFGLFVQADRAYKVPEPIPCMNERLAAISIGIDENDLFLKELEQSHPALFL